MSDKYQTFTEMLNAWWGGAITVLIAGLTGRMMWHANEARAKRRKVFGPELLWEMPLTIGMVFVGEAFCLYINTDAIEIRAGVIGVLAYIGPRGAEALLMRWVSTKIPPGKD